MLVRIGLENGMDGRPLAWALDFPGLFAYGPDSSAAILNMPRAAVLYREWIGGHGGEDPFGGEMDLDFRLVETFEVYRINQDRQPDPHGDYEVNAWFADDERPLEANEIEHGLRLLAWSRADLLEVAQSVSREKLEAPTPGERWSMAGVIAHVATAEWWYLSRLGLGRFGSRQELPADPFERLAAVRAVTREVLPTLSGRADLNLEADGEQWSPRKVLRRAVWHERDHWMHISRLALS